MTIDDYIFTSEHRSRQQLHRFEVLVWNSGDPFIASLLDTRQLPKLTIQIRAMADAFSKATVELSKSIAGLAKLRSSGLTTDEVLANIKDKR